MITKATFDDIATLEKLINSAYRGETSKQGWATEAHLLEGKRITLDQLEEILKDKNNTILKYTENNQIIGSVLLTNKGDKLYLGMLAISPELQNKGIGKKILHEAEVHALSLGLSKIVMTVITIREKLIEWYNRHGYVDTRTREPFLLNDADTIITDQHLEFAVLEKIL
ncbi:acetyltransferase (GNAT) family protein [Flavobacterium sp. 1]|uniref:GNAT family N-acetyltransferase n=1 Tax=Flavobacterium sp. 1 TaxID=2035200 RepID=UPI000C23413F|nr:GNAT family N-acetyltransferase [Flavobacterium sp. 1]PJJ08485.1 acetyltransferase (GNAT) family protein [Flavobacterium sp. 1]